MALIRLGALVTQISGKIGGQTLGTSATGSYIKNSGTPRKAITNLQLHQMANMATTAQSWRTLTNAERAVFNAASSSYPYLNRVGETKYYNGYQIYCKLKRNFENTLSSSLPVPLPVFSFDLLLGFTFQKTLASYTVSMATGQTAVYLRLFCTRPASKGITNGYRNFFFIKAFLANAISTPLDITSELQGKFGVINGGTRMYWKLKAISSGTGQELDNIESGYLDIT